jgi:phosphatidylserine decarboxylase
MITGTVALAAIGLAASYVIWRYVWFSRNPQRTIPQGETIVSAADGIVIYVKELTPGDDVIVIKEGVAAKLEDIIRSDVPLPKLLIGVYMSPLDVHYNRVPLQGHVETIRRYPPRVKNVDMWSMVFRWLFRIQPYYRNSTHIIENERLVIRFTGRFKGREISYYVVQIADDKVNGIDCYVSEQEEVAKGLLYGMIRIGSQVDVILPMGDDIRARVKPGDKVKAGETILAD